MSRPALIGGLDLALSQREWANDLTTWVIHNKLLYTGPSALDHFSQALLLHLQSMSSTNTIASAASILLNQVSPGCLSKLKTVYVWSLESPRSQQKKTCL